MDDDVHLHRMTDVVIETSLWLGTLHSTMQWTQVSIVAQVAAGPVLHSLYTDRVECQSGPRLSYNYKDHNQYPVSNLEQINSIQQITTGASRRHCSNMFFIQSTGHPKC
jgi:hypothetical protein